MVKAFVRYVDAYPKRPPEPVTDASYRAWLAEVAGYYGLESHPSAPYADLYASPECATVAEAKAFVREQGYNRGYTLGPKGERHFSWSITND